MKIVGITSYSDSGKLCLNKAYTEAFARPGLLPVIIPMFQKQTKEFAGDEKELNEKAKETAEKLDVLVLSGGGDINPISFGEKNASAFSCNVSRDTFEVMLLREFLAAGKPIMGICRGFQVIGSYFGFPNFNQDLGHRELHNGNDRSLSSRTEPAHYVKVYGDFLEYYKDKLVREKFLPVNSWHHQGFSFCKDPDNIPKDGGKAIRDLYTAKEFEIFAETQRVIEGFENKKAKVFAVQWHPEEYGNKGLTIQYFIDKHLV